MAYWRHLERSKTDNTPDPTEAAFFSNEAVGNFSNAVVREGCQNSLDEVKDESQPAFVRISLSGEKYAVASNDAYKIIKDLIPHLQAENNGIISSQLPDFTRPMKFLTFEDFNTEGLEGDPFEYKMADYTDPKKRHHNFYFFWRAYGRSGKLANKMGSWGVGKSVFPALSKINAFWTLTIRNSDNEAYLIGQSVLKSHTLVDKPADCGYFPYGYYANYEADGFAIPENDLSVIHDFSSLFRLKRQIDIKKEKRGDNTGLSIIVPYPNDEVSIDSLLYSTIHQFFYPILIKKLVMEICHEDRSFLLSSETLKDCAQRIDFSKLGIEEHIKKQFLSLFDFIDWTNSLTADEHIYLQFENPKRAFEWRKNELFKGIDLTALQTKFDSGLGIALKIPIKHQPEGKLPELRFFTVYIKKDELVQEPESIFIRGYLTISGIKSLKRKGIRGLVVLSDPDLVTFFGQAEGPAHTGWHKDNFRVRFEDVNECISFVKNSLEKLYTILLPPSEGLDKNLLKDIFYLNSETPNSKTKPSSLPGNKDPIPPPSLPLPPISQNVLKQLPEGFEIAGNPKYNGDLKEVNLQLAYLRLEGDPFLKYSKFDFDLDHFKIKTQNVKVIIKSKNILQFEPLSKDYKLKVEGFDTKRDLIVEVN